MKIADYRFEQPPARKPREKNDDLFSRRLSDSNRRTSLTPIPQISVVKAEGEKGPKANNTPSSSFPSTSASSQSYSAPSSNTASARLKARLHADDPKSKPPDSSTSCHARVCKPPFILDSAVYNFRSNQRLLARPK